MTVNELKTSLSEGLIKNLYLFYGEEDYLIRLYIARIKDAVITNPALEDLNFMSFDKFDKSVFEDAVNTLPAFSDKKLIVFDETGVFKSPKKEDKEYLEEVLCSLPDYVTVIFRETEIDSRLKKLTGAAEKGGAIVKFGYMTEKQLATWMASIAEKHNKKISPQVIEYFISCTGSSMSVIENEMSKLCSFSKDTVLTREDVDSIVTKSLENRVFELSECIIKKNSKKAMEIISELRVLKEEPIKVCALVAKNLCDVYRLKSALPENRTPKMLGMHPYAIKVNNNLRISRVSLARIIDSLAKADEKLKSSPIDSWIILEHFVAASFDM